jgi:hypothetical protein
MRSHPARPLIPRLPLGAVPRLSCLPRNQTKQILRFDTERGDPGNAPLRRW